MPKTFPERLEYIKRWNEKNRDKVRKTRSKYNKSHHEVCRNATSKYRSKPGKREELAANEKHRRMTDPKYAAINAFRQAKTSSKKRGLPFTITREFAIEICQRKCAYCGGKPKLVNGMDRKDSKRGYEPDNINPSCIVCNRAKMDMPYDQWMEHLIALSVFQRKKAYGMITD